MVFGIIVRMYYAPKEHNTPHIHIYYQDFKCVLDILSCEILEGEIPSRQLRLVTAWIEIHREELVANWKLCQNGEKRSLDMKPYLNKGIFMELNDIILFNTVKIRFDTVEWDNEADLDPEFLYRESKPL